MHEPNLVQTSIRIGVILLLDPFEHSKLVRDLLVHVRCHLFQCISAFGDDSPVQDCVVRLVDLFEQPLRIFIEAIDKLLHVRQISTDDPKEDVTAPEEVPMAQSSNLTAPSASGVGSLIQ